MTGESPKNGEKIQIITCETSKMYLLQTSFFWTSHFDNSPFLSQLTYKQRVIYPKRKLCIVGNECSFEIGRISVMRVRQIKRVHPNLYGAPCKLMFYKSEIKSTLVRFFQTPEHRWYISANIGQKNWGNLVWLLMSRFFTFQQIFTISPFLGF